MKFLFLFSTSTLTGQAAQSFNILRHLVIKGHKVFVVTDQNREGDLNSRICSTGARLIQNVSISNKNKFFKKIKEIKEIQSIVMDLLPDFVITSFSNEHFLSYLAIRKLSHRIKIVRFFHNYYIRTDFVHRNLYSNTDIFIFFDNDILGNFKTKYNSIKDRLFLLPTSVDTKFYIPRDNNRESFGLKNTDFVIGYVGMFQKGRMHKELIDSFFHIKKRIENAKILMVGSGETLKEVMKYAYKRGNKEDIIFTGFIEDTKLVDAYNTMDIFILLKGGHDSSLRMLYEAQSCGTYILTYKNYPAIRLIDTTKYGNFISDVTNIEIVSDSVYSSKSFINNDFRFDTHSKVDREFGIEKQGEQFIKICEDLIRKYD